MVVSVDAQALAASLRRLQERRRDTVLEDSLQNVVDACAELFGIHGCGVMLVDEHGELHYVASTDVESRLLEAAQLDAGQGPCVESFVRDKPVASDDVRADGRWPALAERLVGRKVGGVLGVPLRLRDVPVGSLDVYCGRPYRWTDDQQDALGRFGEVAEAVIAAAVSAERAGELAARLAYVLDHRAPIERATGYLMARDHLGRPAAFELLRRAARAQRRGLGDVAADLLDAGRLPDEDA